MTYDEYQSKTSSIVKSTMETIESYNKLEQPALKTIRKILYGQLDKNFREVIYDRS